MSRMDTGKAVTLVAVAFVVVSVGVAAVASWSRRGFEQDLERTRLHVAKLHEQVAARESVEPARPEAVPAGQIWQLLHGPEIVETLQALQELGDRAGVVLDMQKALAGVEAGKQSFAVAGHGAPTAVCTFLAEIERAHRLLVVETGHVKAAGVEQLVFELGVGTYHVRGAR